MSNLQNQHVVAVRIYAAIGANVGGMVTLAIRSNVGEELTAWTALLVPGFAIIASFIPFARPSAIFAGIGATIAYAAGLIAGSMVISVFVGGKGSGENSLITYVAGLAGGALFTWVYVLAAQRGSSQMHIGNSAFRLASGALYGTVGSILGATGGLLVGLRGAKASPSDFAGLGSAGLVIGIGLVSALVGGLFGFIIGVLLPRSKR